MFSRGRCPLGVGAGGELAMASSGDKLHQGGPVLDGGSAAWRSRASDGNDTRTRGHGGEHPRIGRQLNVPGFAYVAPQAANDTWYPYSFLAPMEQNEPWLSSALARVGEMLAQVGDAGIPPERTMLLGFSQGACLTLEYVARHAIRYGGVVGLSGGLIGPEGTARHYAGSLAGTAVFLGCSDVDFHIPKERVLEIGRDTARARRSGRRTPLPQHGAHRQPRRDSGGEGDHAGDG